MSEEPEFIKSITMQVSAQIIKHISAGLYRTPASSLKELMSNSFDADATTVETSFYLGRDKYGELSNLKKIVVRDNGTGMNLDDLYYVFSHIGGSKKQDVEDPDPHTPKGRPKIGRLGIGILSVAAACKGFIVRTKKMEEEREYIAEIRLDFFSDIITRTESMDKFKIGNIKLYSRSVPGFDYYTEIEISRFTPPFLEGLMERLGDSYVYMNPDNIEPTSAESASEHVFMEKFVEYIQNEGKIKALPLFDQIVADLGLMSAVEYLPNGPVRKTITWKEETYKIPGADSPELEAIKNRLRNYNFKVYCNIYIQDSSSSSDFIIRNRFRLFRPLLYPTVADIEYKGSFKSLSPYVYVIPENSRKVPDEDGNFVENSVGGFYYFQNGRILPQEYRGMIVRVYDVALGNEFSDPFKMYVDQYLLFQQSLMEVHLNKGFQSIVNLDREGLFEGSNSYRFLKNYLLNYFKGNEPPKPPDPTVDERETRKGSVEKEFIEEQRRLFPERKEEAIFSQVKKRVRKAREEKITSAQTSVKQDILDSFGLKNLLLDKVEFPDETKVIVDKDIVEAKIPKFSKRKEIWESIFITVGLHLAIKSPPEQVFKALFELYKKLEENS